MVFTFTGKSGVDHRIEIDDPSVIEAVAMLRRRRMDDTRLLAYKEQRSWRSVLPAAVNDYLRLRTGTEGIARTSAPGMRPFLPPPLWQIPQSTGRPGHRANALFLLR